MSWDYKEVAPAFAIALFIAGSFAVSMLARRPRERDCSRASHRLRSSRGRAGGRAGEVRDLQAGVCAMNDNDRELLERAAKAAGLYDEWPEPGGVQWNGRGLWRSGAGRGVLWNPLTDDGDALRLAVQCSLEVSIIDDEPGADGEFARACVGYASETDRRVCYVFEDHRGDIFKATRRAIVRAAAALGDGHD